MWLKEGAEGKVNANCVGERVVGVVRQGRDGRIRANIVDVEWYLVDESQARVWSTRGTSYTSQLVESMQRQERVLMPRESVRGMLGMTSLEALFWCSTICTYPSG